MHAYDQMTEPELQRHMTALARAVEAKLPKNTGFVLLCAPFNSSGIAQYVSNVQRVDARDWLAETIARWDGGDYIDRTNPL